MTLSLVQTPQAVGDISLTQSENPILYIFETGTVGAGSKAYTTITYNANLFIAGETLTITINGVAPIIFTAGATVNTQQYIDATSLVSIINTHPLLNWRYYAKDTGTDIVIIAKKSGDAYDIVATTAAAGVTIVDTPGTNTYEAQDYPFFAAWVKVFINNPEISTFPTNTNFNIENETLVATLYKDFTPDNKFVFDLNKVLMSYVSWSTPVYAPASILEDASELLRMYWIEYGYRSNTLADPTPYDVPVDAYGEEGGDEVLWILNAHSNILTPELLSAYWSNTPGDVVEPLTHIPNNTLTYDKSLVYIYFFTGAALGDFIRGRITLYFNDGTTTQFTTDPFDVSNATSIMYIAFHPELLDFSSYEIGGLLIKKFDVEVVATGDLGVNPITEKRTFYYDSQVCTDFYRNFVFQTALGGFDAVTFVGNSEESLEVDEVDYEGTLIFDPLDTTQFQKAVQHKEIIPTFKTSSGWVDRDTYEWLRELVKSPVVFIDMENGEDDETRFKPIIITKAEWVNNTADYTNQLTIEWQYSQRENYTEQ